MLKIFDLCKRLRKLALNLMTNFYLRSYESLVWGRAPKITLPFFVSMSFIGILSRQMY